MYMSSATFFAAKHRLCNLCSLSWLLLCVCARAHVPAHARVYMF